MKGGGQQGKERAGCEAMKFKAHYKESVAGQGTGEAAL